MDENKNEEKKKESIDEILSDLNSLLNKMPAIIEGVKLPETPDKTVQSAAPQPAPEQEKEDAFDKTLKLDPEEIASSPSGGSVDKMVLQSLDACILSPESLETPDADSRVSEPLALPVEHGGAAPGSPETRPLSEENMPDSEQQPSSAGEEKQPSSPGTPEDVRLNDAQPLEERGDAVSDPGKNEPDLKASSLDSTGDFGIPDIDALMNLSQGVSSADSGEASVSGAASGQNAEADPLPTIEEASMPRVESGAEDIIVTPIGDPGVVEERPAETKNEPSVVRDDSETTDSSVAGAVPGTDGHGGDSADDTIAVPPGQSDEAKACAGISEENLTLEPLMSAAPEELVLEPAQPPMDSGPAGNGQTAASEDLVLEPAQPLADPVPADEEKTLVIPPPAEQSAAPEELVLEPLPW